MKRKQKKAGESGPKVPGYIVTFSDMVTLLLTFFVLLLSLADVQDPELFNRGRDSFWKSIRYCGLGKLLGKEVQMNLGDMKIKHKTNEPEDSTKDRTIDEKRERLRRIFEKINQSATTMPSQLTADRTNFQVAKVRFSPDSIKLDNTSKQFLQQFSMNLKQTLEPSNNLLYVVGLADEVTTTQQQYSLSAGRAKAVADFIKQNLSADNTININSIEDFPDNNWDVLWWGAGSGTSWTGQNSNISGKPQILIAVVKKT